LLSAVGGSFLDGHVYCGLVGHISCCLSNLSVTTHDHSESLPVVDIMFMAITCPFRYN